MNNTTQIQNPDCAPLDEAKDHLSLALDQLITGVGDTISMAHAIGHVVSALTAIKSAASE